LVGLTHIARGCTGVIILCEKQQDQVKIMLQPSVT